MKLPAFKTKEEVPASMLDLYEEKDGEWRQKEDTEATGLKTALEKERLANKAAATALAEARKAADDLRAEVAAGKAGMEPAELKAFKEGVYKEVRAEIAAEVDGIKKQLGESQGETRGLRLDTKVKALALSKEGGVEPAKLEDWWALNGHLFDLDEQNAPIVKDGKGKAVGDFIAQDLKKQRPYLYVGSQAGGGGGGGDRPKNGAGALTFEDFSKLSPADKLARAREAEAK